MEYTVNMELGKLYQIKKHFWYLYPSKDIAAIASGDAPAPDDAAYYSEFWSKEFNCNVSYISPETIFFPVEIDGKYVKIVSGEGIGWMVYTENKAWNRCTIEEVKQ